MIGHRDRIRQLVGSALGWAPHILTLPLCAPAGAADLAPNFLRGDANADGRVSLSDALLIKRWALSYGEFYIIPTDIIIPCLDAADATDDGWVDEGDTVAIACELFFGGTCLPMGPIRAPFPSVGPDTTRIMSVKKRPWGTTWLRNLRSHDRKPRRPAPPGRVQCLPRSGGGDPRLPDQLPEGRGDPAGHLLRPQVLSPLPDPAGTCRSTFDFQGSTYGQLFDSAHYSTPCVDWVWR